MRAACDHDCKAVGLDMSSAYGKPTLRTDYCHKSDHLEKVLDCNTNAKLFDVHSCEGCLCHDGIMAAMYVIALLRPTALAHHD